MKRPFILLVILTLLVGCSVTPKGPEYSSPYSDSSTSLRSMVASPASFIGVGHEYVVGPLIVESNDLTRKMLTIRPLTEDEQPDTDVQIELSYGSAKSTFTLIDLTKDDVIYALGFMSKYSNSSNYYFYAESIRMAIVDKK